MGEEDSLLAMLKKIDKDASLASIPGEGIVAKLPNRKINWQVCKGPHETIRNINEYILGGFEDTKKPKQEPPQIDRRTFIATQLLSGMFANPSAMQIHLDIPFAVMVADKLIAELDKPKEKK